MGGFVFKLGFGNYGGTELAAEMQAKLRTVDNTAQATYASKTGRIAVIMGTGYELKVVSDEELTNPAFQTERVHPHDALRSARSSILQ